MAMTNAERQRKFRKNRDKDLQRRHDYLQNEKERYKKAKASGKKVSTKELTDREKRILRRKWKQNKAKLRAKKKLIQDLTPPTSPEIPRPTSRQRAQYRRQLQRDKAKVYRDNKGLRLRLESEKKRAEMYKKRWQRELSKGGADTPRTKTRKLLRKISKKNVKRTILFHTALLDQMKAWYKQKRKNRDKNDIAAMLSGSILRKYRFKTEAWYACGVGARKQLGTKRTECTERTALSLRQYQKIKQFYERDDISRLMTGTKRTVTFKKQKKQKRILQDTLKHIFLKYRSEGNNDISFSTFCKLRPFWVVFPNPSDRNTCLCKTCENTQFMVSALKTAGAIKSDSLDTMISELVCDSASEICMYSRCQKCLSNRIPVDQKTKDNTTQWMQWRLKTEKRTMKVKNNEITKDIHFTVKETQFGSVSDLTDSLEKEMDRYKRHSFNIKHQYKYYKERKENLRNNECLFHVDFSENYVCKMTHEIQSMHFGASKKQLSLHTGVYYCGGSAHAHTFCTVSENLLHGPGAIWAHLNPILQKVTEEHPGLDSIEIFSDGPTAQYRQKANFHLLTSKPLQFGFKNVVWNYFEAGHGKGVPDAVGGAVKRNADRHVKYGKDITSAEDFTDAMKDSEVYTIIVSNDEITKEVNDITAITLKCIKGTLKLHQVYAVSNGVIAYRDVSCVCRQQNECLGHKLEVATLTVNQKEMKATHNKAGPGKKQPVKHKRQNDKRGKQAKNKKTGLENGLEKHKQNTTTEAQPVEKQTLSKGQDENTFEEHQNLEGTFGLFLQDIKKCKSIHQLKRKCNEISNHLGQLKKVAQPVTFSTHGLEVDLDALETYPCDVPDNRTLYPCAVMSDGNCLPSCGSVHAFGAIDRTAEMRVRILCELIVNEERYLDSDYLSRGLNGADGKKQNLPYIYAQYSDMFIAGSHLTDRIVQNIFRLETLKIRQNKTFMGIWQIHALSSVLNTPVFSVYPKLGSPCVRQDLHRLIMPGDEARSGDVPIYILWTSTRRDMNNQNWLPNHFVPVLPICQDEVNTIQNKINDEGLEKNKNVTKSKDEMKVSENELRHTGTEVDMIVNVKEDTGDEVDMAEHEIKRVKDMIEKTRDEVERVDGPIEKTGDEVKMDSHDVDMVKDAIEKSGVEVERVEDAIEKTENEIMTVKRKDRANNEVETKYKAEMTNALIEVCVDELLMQSPLTVSDVYPIELLPACTEDFPQTASTALDVNPQTPSTATDVTPTEPISASSDGLHQTLSTASDTISPRSPSVLSDVASTLPYTALDVSCQTISTAADATPAEPVSVSSDGLIQTLSTATDVIAPTSSSVTSDLINQIPSTALDVNPQTPSTATDVTTTEPISVSSDGLHQALSTASDAISSRSPSVSSDVASMLPYTALDVSCQTISTAADATSAEPVSVSSDGLIQTLSTASDVIPPRSSSASTDGLPQSLSTVASTDNQQTSNTSTIASRVNTVNDHSLRKVCISAKPKTFNDLKRELPMPEELVGKHVIVLYDGSAYPGKVLDVYEKQELYVECMQQIVKKQNCFIWPKLKDRCWYDYGTSVVALIPKPKAMVANEKPGHRQVDPEIWKIVMQELNK